MLARISDPVICRHRHRCVGKPRHQCVRNLATAVEANQTYLGWNWIFLARALCFQSMFYRLALICTFFLSRLLLLFFLSCSSCIQYFLFWARRSLKYNYKCTYSKKRSLRNHHVATSARSGPVLPTRKAGQIPHAKRLFVFFLVDAKKLPPKAYYIYTLPLTATSAPSQTSTIPYHTIPYPAD